MVQTLYLLRHTEAESWNPLGNDFSRPLSTAGNRHAKLVSDWAFETLSPPDTILCSPAKRTRETLAPFLSHWRRLLATTDYIDSMYGASLNMFLTLAGDAFSYSDCLFMVGHNPGIEHMLTNQVAANGQETALRMAPGSMAVIEFPRGFKSHSNEGRLCHFAGPEKFSID